MSLSKRLYEAQREKGAEIVEELNGNLLAAIAAKAQKAADEALDALRAHQAKTASKSS